MSVSMRSTKAEINNEVDAFSDKIYKLGGKPRLTLSSKATKAQLYSELERLRALHFALSTNASVAEVSASGMKVVSPTVKVTEVYKTAKTFPEFCRLYCETLGVRSVPFSAAQRWKQLHA